MPIKIAANAAIAITADTGIGDPNSVTTPKHKLANIQLAMTQIGQISLSTVFSN
jgi:hypothetical protein